MIRTRPPGRPAFSALALIAAFAVPVLPAAGQERRAESVTISGSDVAVYNLIGDARVVRGNGPHVEVEIAWGGDDARELTVETGRIGHRETLRIVYPGREFVHPDMGFLESMEMSVNDDGTFGDIGRKGRRVRISGRGSGLEARADLTIRVPDGIAFGLSLGVGEIRASGVHADLRLDTSASPVTAAEIRGALVIDVGSGSVEVRDVEGDVAIDTGSGHVSLENVAGNGLSVDTGSGHVEGSGIRVADLEVDTGSGRIDVSGVECRRIHLDTGSGGVDLGLLTDVDDISIDTGSGGVRLAVPRSLGAEVEVETGSGGIVVDVPHESHRHRRDVFRGTFGDGNGRITIETGSGGVRFTEI